MHRFESCSPYFDGVFVIVLVCGGRKYSNYARVEAVLDELHAKFCFSVVRHGAATGADSLAGKWARLRGVAEDPVPAEWRRYGNKKAGRIRNKAMLDKGGVQLVVAFPGRSGTAHMMRIAEDRDIVVIAVSD